MTGKSNGGAKVLCTLRGNLLDVSKGVTVKGETYLRGRMCYVAKGTGRASQVTAMLFGDVSRMGPAFLEGPAELFGEFRGGAFRVIGEPGVKPAGPPAAPAARVGHYRTQAVGAGRSTRRVVWVDPVPLAA